MSAPMPVSDGSSFDRVIEALGDRVTRLDHGRRHADACCPAHDDQRPSLTVDWRDNPAKGGMTLVSCHAVGCDYREILNAVGLSPVDAYDTDRAGYTRRPANSSTRTSMSKRAHTSKSTSAQAPARRRAPLPPLEQEYPYATPDGVVVGWFRRHEGKQFRWHRVAANGNRVDGQPKPCPLYLQPTLAAAIAAGRIVHLAEGEKDADALVEAGEVAVSIPNGVTVAHTGATKNLTDEHVEAFRDAHVVIWGDRDGPDSKKPERGYQGYRHAMYVRDRLTGVAASVRVVEAKHGKDAYDHLAAGHTPGDAVEITPEHQVPAAVLARWGVAVPEPAGEGESGADVIDFPSRGPELADLARRGGGGSGRGGREKRELYVRDRFEIAPDRDALVQVDENSETIRRRELINAIVRITRRVVRDMGEGHDAESLVDLEVSRHGETHVLNSLRWEDFENPTKWAPRVPLGLTFSRGQGRGKVVNAIIECSGVVPVITAYGMLGWREISPGRWVYLHAGGAIGADGTLLGTRVEVSPRLRDFVLPDPPAGEDLRCSYDAMMALTEELPAHIAYPLIAAGARAVLGDCSTSLFLLGKTATYKSGTAALVQQMYDPTARYDHLPAGAGEAASTVSALEQLVYEAGHAVLVLDDLAPDRGTARSAARGAEILRMVGNRQSKARQSRDTSGLRADKVTRAFVLVTGEDQPNVQSAERRTIYVKFNKGDVTKRALKALSAPWMIKSRTGLTAALAQRTAGRMPTTEWLEQQRDYFAEHLAEGWDDADGLIAGRCNTVAELAIGMRELLDAMLDAGVITPDEAESRWNEAWAAFRGTLAAQFEIVDRRGLTERAADLLRSAFRAGRGHLLSQGGGVPSSPQRFGWQGTELAIESRAGGAGVGWTDGENWLWLDPGAAFALIEAEGKAQSDPLDVNKRALKAAFIDDGLLTVEKNPDGGVPREPRVKVGGARQRVWELPYRWLYPDDSIDDDPAGPDTNPTQPPAPPSPEGPSSSTPGPHPAGGRDITPESADQHTEMPVQGTEKPAQTPVAASPGARQASGRTGHGKTRSAPPRALGGDGRGYKAAGVVVDVDEAYFIGGYGDQVSLPEQLDTISDLVGWANRLYLGIRRPGGRTARERGARDDAGLLVIMPKLAAKLGIPAKAPDRTKPGATKNKTVRLLSADGWTVGERGLQPYTQVWPTAGGPAMFVVIPQWIKDEPLFADVDEAGVLAYRLALFIGQLGMQLIYTSRSTGAELLKQLRAFTDYPLVEKVTEVPPPGEHKEHAPIEDGEWNHWRTPTDDEANHYPHLIMVDVNAHYVPAAASVVVGHGQPEQQLDVEIPADIRKTPGYWLVDQPANELDPRLPDPWRPSLDDRRTDGPRWVTTPYLIMLREAGYQIDHAHEAWLYPHPGCHLQIWAHKIRDSLYDLDEHLRAIDDPDAKAVQKTVKLTYAGGIGMMGSERWKRGTELWLPHYRHSTIGLAMANQWRKVKATAEATDRYPIGIYRDALIYPATTPDVDGLPVVERGFKIQRTGDPYRLGMVKLAATATMADYLEAQAVTDLKERRNALERIWRKVNGAADERSE